MFKRVVPLALAAVALLAFAGMLAQSERSDSKKSGSASNAPQDALTVESAPAPTVRSSLYHFVFRQDASMDHRVVEDDLPSALLVEFSLPNADSGEVPNRDTPNGINTKDRDVFSLRVFRNSFGLVADQPSRFRDWWLGVSGQEMELQAIGTMSIAGRAVFSVVLPNGIDSHEVVYALPSPELVYVFSTEDFPEVAMRRFVAGFTPG